MSACFNTVQAAPVLKHAYKGAGNRCCATLACSQAQAKRQHTETSACAGQAACGSGTSAQPAPRTLRIGAHEGTSPC